MKSFGTKQPRGSSIGFSHVGQLAYPCFDLLTLGMFTIQHSDSLFQGSHQPEDAARIVAKGPSGKELETKLMRNGKNWEQDLETLLPSVVSGPFLATSVAVSSSATKSDNFADRPKSELANVLKRSYSYGM